MTPYMEDGHMVHACVKLPGLSSKVTSRVGEDTRTYYYHCIRDEFTGMHDHHENSEYQLKSDANGQYLAYCSGSESDFGKYMQAHRAAVELWTELYMVGDVGTMLEAVEQAERNAKAYTAARLGSEGV